MTLNNQGPVFASTTPRMLVAVFAVMVSLFVATGFLTGRYRRERQLRAERQYQAGQKLAAEGQYEKAIDQYTEALTLSRDNLTYRQALALALVKVGRTNEAEAYLQELTRSDPTNGIANLMLARIYADRGDFSSAFDYYQRAIYGLWPEDAEGNRIKVRFELIELLDREGKRTQMTAELLRLVDEIPDDPAMKKRIGRLFLAAQSLDNAAKMFTEVLKQNPKDPEAYAGLGDAEFGMAHYLSARTAYRRALLYNPEDLQSRSQLELATEIIDLDPTRRGLGSATKLRRSQELVKRALAAMEYCLPEDLTTLPDAFRQAVEQAQKLASGKLRQRRTSEAMEANIALAEQLEKLRTDNCGVPPVPDRALELLLKKLAE